MDKRMAKKVACAMLACEGLLASCDFSEEDKARIEEAADEIENELRSRASAIGAPHRRDRLFIVGMAHASGGDGAERGADTGRQARSGPDRHGPGELAHADGKWQPQPKGGIEGERGWAGDCHQTLANPDGEREREPQHEALSIARSDAWASSGRGGGREPVCGLGGAVDGLPRGLDGRWPAGPGEDQHPWETPRTAQGQANRPARLKALGNAVVPLVGYVIGCAVRAELERRGL